MLKGQVIKYGDNIDTDVIIPARYLTSSDSSELAKHCMEDLDSTFKDRINSSSIMVAGKNFGCGSSREHAPIAIKASGISCVIASSFARIFYRNSINIGLSIIECQEAASEITDGDIIEINVDEGIINNITQGKEYKAKPFPEFIKRIIESDGLINYTRERMKED